MKNEVVVLLNLDDVFMVSTYWQVQFMSLIH